MISAGQIHGGVAMSALGYGAAPLGNLYSEVSDAESDAAVAAALAAGIRYFDTAPHYGLGLSERRLGRSLAGADRDSFTVSTKVGRLLRRNPSPVGTDMANLFAVADDYHRVDDYTRDGVRASVTESLERLGLDYIDVALVHDPDDIATQAATETIPALIELREEGLVQAVGAGMNQWQALKFFAEETDVDVVMIAGRWTLLDRSALPLLDTCQERGVTVLAAAAFNSGILTSNVVPDDAKYNYSQARPELIDKARRLAAICDRNHVQLAAAALQFPLRHPAVASVVCGMRSAAEVERDAFLLASPIPDECWAEFDALRLRY
jgi:D-threo-aldose 1-dehydrogenase